MVLQHWPPRLAQEELFPLHCINMPLNKENTTGKQKTRQATAFFPLFEKQLSKHLKKHARLLCFFRFPKNSYIISTPLASRIKKNNVNIYIIVLVSKENLAGSNKTMLGYLSAYLINLQKTSYAHVMTSVEASWMRERESWKETLFCCICCCCCHLIDFKPTWETGWPDWRRIFVQWVIVCFVKLYENYRSSPHFWATLFNG
jgi:hypothetical protein